MKDFKDDIIKLSEEYVVKNIINPNKLDYLLFQNAMMEASIKTMELVIEGEREYYAKPN